jgi:putative SOS response-associated peptidase YedK
MAFAGLWEVWRDEAAAELAGLAAGDVLRSCTIITTEANGLLAPIHSRMPVVLPPSTWEQWLDPATEDPELLQSLLVPAPEDWFDAFIVSSRVNAVANEGSELLDPAPPPDRGTDEQAAGQIGLFDTLD